MWSNSYSCIRPGSLMSMSSRSCRNTPQNRNCRSSRWLKPYRQKNRHPHSPYSSSRCSRCYSLYSRYSLYSHYRNLQYSCCNYQNNCYRSPPYSHYHTRRIHHSHNNRHSQQNSFLHSHCIYRKLLPRNLHNSSLCTHYHSRRYTLCMLRHILIRIHNNHYSQYSRFHSRQSSSRSFQCSYSHSHQNTHWNKNRYSPNTTSYTRMRSHPHSPYSSSRCSHCCTRSTPNTLNR